MRGSIATNAPALAPFCGRRLDAALERVVGRALELEVEREAHPLALRRLLAAHPPAVVARAERVDHDLREAVGAAQVPVVALLDAVGADPRARLDAPVALELELGRRDLARGPEQLGAELVVRVVAQVLLLDLDAGELLPALADVVERRAADRRLDRHVRVRQLGDALDHALVDQLRAHVDHAPELAVEAPQVGLVGGRRRDRDRRRAAGGAGQPAALAALAAGGAAAALADVALERAQLRGGGQARLSPPRRAACGTRPPARAPSRAASWGRSAPPARRAS